MSDYIGSDWYYQVIDILKKHQHVGTWLLASKIKIKTTRCLRLMNVMEKHGVVRRSEYSQRNNIVWELAA